MSCHAYAKDPPDTTPGLIGSPTGRPTGPVWDTVGPRFGRRARDFGSAEARRLAGQSGGWGGVVVPGGSMWTSTA